MEIKYLKILTGCAKIDVQIIEALIDYTQMSALFRTTMYRLESSKITPKEYEYLDKFCYKAYMNNEYQDYLKARQQEEGVGIYHKTLKNDIKNHGYYIREFGFSIQRPYLIIRDFNKRHIYIKGKQGNIEWIEPVMSYNEFENNFLASNC